MRKVSTEDLHLLSKTLRRKAEALNWETIARETEKVYLKGP